MGEKQYWTVSMFEEEKVATEFMRFFRTPEIHEKLLAHLSEAMGRDINEYESPSLVLDAFMGPEYEDELPRIEYE